MEYNYNIEELKKTWDFYDNESKEIIKMPLVLLQSLLTKICLKDIENILIKIILKRITLSIFSS